MGLFTQKCPRCGGPLVRTGYCVPYPSHRCNACVEIARQKKEAASLRREIAELKAAGSDSA